MDMDDDFMGEIEFALSPEQGAIVNRAINLAATRLDDEFAHVNPLLAIMQWWQANGSRDGHAGATPEARLAEACRQFLATHGQGQG